MPRKGGRGGDSYGPRREATEKGETRELVSSTSALQFHIPAAKTHRPRANPLLGYTIPERSNEIVHHAASTEKRLHESSPVLMGLPWSVASMSLGENVGISAV